MKAHRMDVLLCAGTGCVANGAFTIKAEFEHEIAKYGLQDEVKVVMTGCNGFCAMGPIAVVQPEGIFYQLLKEGDIPRLVEEHFLKGRPVKELMYESPEEKAPVPLMKDIPFFGKQMLVALRNRGLIDPEKIEDYIARDGYAALAKVLTEMTPQQVIDEIKKAALRGRGGGGFPTGVKWETCRNAPGEKHYVVCNADEGDPGAFMDRSIVEGDPHVVLEGMAIGAYAIGTDAGYIYIRKEYPLVIERFEKAIAQALEYGLLGENILGTDFSFDITIHRGAGAFVCGESTALMASMEGRVGEPRAKYIHTVEHGFNDMPTCLNNVETWANVPVIIRRGADWFTSIGTGDVSKNPWGGSKGTKVFSLVGKIQDSGLIEVPMGITLREIIYDVGGGIPNGKKFKAVQTGGPSGGLLPESCLDLPVDFDELSKVGSMMGSGGMVIMDEDDCMVDISKYFIDFLIGESCGKCVPCREGLRQMSIILHKICDGKGTEDDIQLLEELSEAMNNSALCALGTSATNPVMSTLRYYRDEYTAHVKEKRCPAGNCRALISFSIDKEKCTGCMVCAKQCPVAAISGEKKTPHVIDAGKCTKCGICYEVCKFDAVVKE